MYSGGHSGPPTTVQTPIRWKGFFTYRGYPMYVYCNFYCLPAKKHGSDPHFFGAGDATGFVSLGTTKIERRFNRDIKFWLAKKIWTVKKFLKWRNLYRNLRGNSRKLYKKRSKMLARQNFSPRELLISGMYCQQVVGSFHHSCWQQLWWKLRQLTP